LAVGLEVVEVLGGDRVVVVATFLVVEGLVVVRLVVAGNLVVVGRSVVGLAVAGGSPEVVMATSEHP